MESALHTSPTRCWPGSGSAAAGPVAVLAAVSVLLGPGGCAAPAGETMVVVDTDAEVPRFAGRLRIDLFGADGTWFDSRDVAALEPTSWPLSFGITPAGAGDRTVRVRLRAYPEGWLRDYRGERFRQEPAALSWPHAPSTIKEACEAAPVLLPLTERGMRRGRRPFTDPRPTADCQSPSGSGAVVARVEIAEAGRYRFEALGDPRSLDPGAITLWLRGACDDAESQLAAACRVDSDARARLFAELGPGTYFLLASSTAIQQAADLTLRWSREDHVWDPPARPRDPPDDSTALPPRLVVDGLDVTPRQEPQPGVTIDRLVDVQVDGDGRATVHLLLSGECLGTMADLAGGRTCVDQAGVLQAVTRADRTPGLDHGAPTRAGSWAGARSIPCELAPRSGHSAAGTPLFDEEVCVPGGAFHLGDPQSGEARVVVVEPFLLDRFELTVGRYRALLAAGFKPADETPLRRDIDFAGSDPRLAWTFSGDAGGPAPGLLKDRERMPLNAVSPLAAEAICAALGARLPTAVEWEYAARAAGRSGAARYPTGDEAPGCGVAAVGRSYGMFLGPCARLGVGPVAVDSSPWSDADRTPLGLSGLAGGVREITASAARSLDHPCWHQASLRGLDCTEPDGASLGARGSAWSDAGPAPAFTATEAPTSQPSADLGFRCARPGRAR